MKRGIFALILALSAISSFAQNDSTSQNQSRVYIGLELFKPLYWLMNEQSIVIEPEVTYQNKNVLYRASYGYVDIQSIIYNDLPYQVTGHFVKLGVGVEIDYYFSKNSKNDIIAGANLIFSSGKESGQVHFAGQYFEDLNTKVIQNNSTRGLEVYFTDRKRIAKKLFFEFTARSAYVINDYQDQKFAMYYSPGFGVMNIWGVKDMETHNKLSGGISIKLAYQLR